MMVEVKDGKCRPPPQGVYCIQTTLIGLMPIAQFASWNLQNVQLSLPYQF